MSRDDADRGTPGGDDAAAPSVRIVRGQPDDVELAALVAGLAAVGGAYDDEDGPGAHDGWSDRSYAHRSVAGAHRSARAWRWSLRG